MFISREPVIIEHLSEYSSKFVDSSFYPNLKVTIDGHNVTSLFLTAEDGNLAGQSFISHPKLLPDGNMWRSDNGSWEIYHTKGDVVIDLGERDDSPVGRLTDGKP